ncbi:MAG: aldehyde dehydrogenase family protein [Syntrophorhabdaceae bacterium]
MLSIFPYEKNIPPDMLQGIPIARKDYLLYGKVEHWRGPFREVYSPLLTNGLGGLSSRRIGSVPSMDEEASLNIAREAKRAFHDGQGQWPGMHTGERIERFGEFLDRMENVKQAIIHLLEWEIGKTYTEARNEFERAQSFARGCFERVSEYSKQKSIIVHNGISGRLDRIPRGVVLIMGPFNYPLFETMTALAPAMLAGNTVIIKPPRLGCLFFQYLVDLFDIFPTGSINIVYGDGKRIIPPLMSSGMIDVLYFIGTSPVANYLQGLHPKPHRLKSILGLEAKNPAIILPDADIDLAVHECVKGSLTFNGQRCAALKILFVHRSLAGEFNERFCRNVASLKCGMPWEDDVVITPLAETDRSDYLSGLVEDAIGHGARVINENGGESFGTFFSPAVLYPASIPMRVCREEQFGPVVPIVPYDDIEDALKYIRESNYGQQASIFGTDRKVFRDITRFLVHHVSRVNINCQCQRSPDTIPFTGRKDSAQESLSISEAVDAFTVPAFVATKSDRGYTDLLQDIIPD